MKIGIYSPYLDTLTGGEKYILTAASSLSKDHSVTVFWDDRTILQRAANKFNLDLERVEVSQNIFSANTSFLQRLRKTMKYDRILYLSDGSIPLVAAKKLLIHFQFPVEWVNTNSFVYLLKRARISKIICNSHFTKGYIDKKFGGDSFVLYPPADVSQINKNVKENIILTVGRFSMLPNKTDFKKLSVLVDSFKKFQKKRLKGWRLAIVTSVLPEQEVDFAKFEEDIKSTYIDVYKNSSYENILDLYNKSKIYWHAAGYSEDLKKHPERAEHFGISTVEAMAYRSVPVVVNAGGQKEIVKDGETGYLWDTTDELIQKTHKLVIDKELLSQLAQNAQVSSKTFTVERFSEELNHLIW